MITNQFRRFIWALPVTLALACSLPAVGLDIQADEPQTAETLVTGTKAVTEPLDTEHTPVTEMICDFEETEFDSSKFNQTGGRRTVLDHPVMIPASEATWLNADTLVMGVENNGEAHAYPVFQMVYPHIANTEVGGEPYLVTY